MGFLNPLRDRPTPAPEPTPIVIVITDASTGYQVASLATGEYTDEMVAVASALADLLDAAKAAR